VKPELAGSVLCHFREEISFSCWHMRACSLQLNEIGFSHILARSSLHEPHRWTVAATFANNPALDCYSVSISVRGKWSMAAVTGELMHREPEVAGATLVVPASSLLAGCTPVTRVRDPMIVGLTPQTYLPKTLSPRLDWVSSVAVPSFTRYREEFVDSGAGQRVNSFCTVGTGAGLDALGAIEVLSPCVVTVTDIHRDVVTQAVRNIVENLVNPAAVTVRGVDGDLAIPLLREPARFDLVYENLPNLPLSSGVHLLQGQNSASFFQWPRALEGPPPSVHSNLLDLHFALLCQARELLCEEGRILCSIGARRPLAAILDMPRHAGCAGSILTYTWKIQSEATAVLSGFAEFQRKGFGPFHFYPVEVLEAVFTPLSPREAAARAFELENTLAQFAIDAERALEVIQDGGVIGHTVAVIAAKPVREH
jgi:methylase of polypeptide subunit release factors